MSNKALQGTSGQRGFPEITLLPKYVVNQNSVVQTPLAPELKCYALSVYVLGLATMYGWMMWSKCQ